MIACVMDFKEIYIQMGVWIVCLKYLVPLNYYKLKIFEFYHPLKWLICSKTKLLVVGTTTNAISRYSGLIIISAVSVCVLMRACVCMRRCGSARLLFLQTTQRWLFSDAWWWCFSYLLAIITDNNSLLLITLYSITCFYYYLTKQ